MHKDVKLTAKTEYFLKVGQRPRLGTKHVIAFLEHTNSTTQRPETKLMKAQAASTTREDIIGVPEIHHAPRVAHSPAKTRSYRNRTSMKSAIDKLEEPNSQAAEEEVSQNVADDYYQEDYYSEGDDA